MLGIPLVAIGGINLNNAQQVIEAGADAVAVVGALFDLKNKEDQSVTEVARQFTQLFM